MLPAVLGPNVVYVGIFLTLPMYSLLYQVNSNDDSVGRAVHDIFRFCQLGGLFIG